MNSQQTHMHVIRDHVPQRETAGFCQSRFRISDIKAEIRFGIFIITIQLHDGFIVHMCAGWVVCLYILLCVFFIHDNRIRTGIYMRECIFALFVGFFFFNGFSIFVFQFYRNTFNYCLAKWYYRLSRNMTTAIAKQKHKTIFDPRAYCAVHYTAPVCARPKIDHRYETWMTPLHDE